ncbi:unnamed protein product [Effrenium voratum]|nr:unnamed protein product [Effrenium voratum]
MVPVQEQCVDFTGIVEETRKVDIDGEKVTDPDDINAKVAAGDKDAKDAKAEPVKGALAFGEEVDIYELRNSGFLLQYFAVGVIYGGLPATIYGFFLGYLNVPGYVYATASVVTTMPWSFKVLFGLLNDCLPIRGYRRKPYMVLGWSLCFATLVILAMKPLPEPYYCRSPDGGLDEDRVCNAEAQWAGGSFAMLMCLAALGYVIADVAADGLMVEFAQREPEEKRGTIQTTIYLVRSLGCIASVALVGVGMNGKESTTATSTSRCRFRRS